MLAQRLHSVEGSLAKHDGKRFGLTYKSTSPPVSGTKLRTLVGSPARHDGDWPGGGGTLERDASDSPSSGAKASTYTSAFTFGFPVAALVMTAPPYEWPTNIIGPVMLWRKIAI